MAPYSTRRARSADVNVKQSIAVDIDNTNASAPRSCAGEFCPFCYILKDETTFIQVKFIGNQVAREENIKQAIVVEVCQAYTASVVKVFESVSVYRFCIIKLVDEVDT